MNSEGKPSPLDVSQPNLGLQPPGCSIVNQSIKSSDCSQGQLPSGPLSADSPFYILRPPLEEQALAEITRPGSLLRLRAPRYTGKSSLLLRLAEAAQLSDYATCTVDFLQADRNCFSDLSSFLRWFCRLCALQLGVPANLDDWWDEEIGSKVSCTIYFEQYLLRQRPQPLVLFLKEVDRVFEHGSVAEDFLSLLRFWYEQGKRSPQWQALRLVMGYSTEVYAPLKLEQSPFNVGVQLNLSEFTPDQVHDLAQRYGLPERLGVDYAPVIAQLIDLVGGQPYLVHLAIAQLQNPEQSSQALIDQATDPSGLYGSYLQRCLAIVRPQPHLVDALKALLIAPEGIALPSRQAYPLNGLGIVKLDGRRCQFSCELYRRYFALEFSLSSKFGALSADPGLLHEENILLHTLAYTDALTQISNRRAFDRHLEQTWQEMTAMGAPITLMMCDIDHFKRYNDTYGHLVGDACLTWVAQVLHRGCGNPTDFVARYGGEEFAIVLCDICPEAAYQQAEQLRSQISTPAPTSTLPQITVSIGVASIVPDPGDRPTRLIAAADRVLYESKRLGRNRVTLITKL